MFFKKNADKTNKNNDLIKIAALLIHAAKIDENYTVKEQKIIKQVLFELGADNSNIENILEDGKKIEENSNQILDFTREIKISSMETKIKIIETLWQIIYSNNDADMYETNLMRRLAGLLYIEDKIVGEIKNKVKGKKI